MIKIFKYGVLRVLFFILFAGMFGMAKAQTITDSAGKKIVVAGKATTTRYDSMMLAHSPHKAAVRSAIIPGWGQAYNKKYWKLPIVYGALGTTAAIFFYNLNTYKDLRFAYKAKYQAALPVQSANYPNPPFRDSTNYFKIKPQYINIDIESLRFNRDDFRRNVDYSVLVFVVFWGLNVVDAAVDAHLKSFDVSPDLSFHLKAGHSNLAGTNGISLVLAFK